MTATYTLADLGEIMATPGGRDAMAEASQSARGLLARHACGDWGDLSDDDKAANDGAVRDGSRIFSAYILATGVKVWVITEAEGDDGRRAMTTVLLPDEY